MTARYGNLPFKAQVSFFRGKVNVPTAAWTDVWQSAHDTAFMVAGAARADLLEDLRQAVTRAIEDGTTLAQFRKEFDAIVERRGWTGWTGEGSARGRAWRTRVIYETNLRTSYAAGRWEQLQTNKDFAPFLEYVHDDSVRFPRPHHQAWDGLILPIDDPWWQAHYPPNGWGCKCTVRALTRGQLERRGRTVDQPPDDGIDPKTGGPAGIDPGFAYTPGASRPRQLGADLRAKAQKLPPQIKRELLADLDAALGNGPGRPPVPPAPGGAGGSPGGGAPPPPGLPDLPPVSGAMPAPPVFSTAKGVTGEALADVLGRIPEGQPQVARLAAFLEAHPVKTLFLKQTEMSTGKTAGKLAPSIGRFLSGDTVGDLDEFTAQLRYRRQYTTSRAGRTNGFTMKNADHVVVKVKATDKLATVDPAELAEVVERVAAGASARERLISNQGRAMPWSIRSALDDMTGGKRPGLLVTWAHEIGHQVHFWGGGRGLRNDSLTQYSRTNNYEWHAEHFVAWLFNRRALAAWRPEVAEYFDELIERATAATAKPGV